MKQLKQILFFLFILKSAFASEIPKRSLSLQIPESKLPSEASVEKKEALPVQMALAASNWTPAWENVSRLANTSFYKGTLPRFDLFISKPISALNRNWAAFVPEVGIGFVNLKREGVLQKNGTGQTFAQNASVFLFSLGFQILPGIVQFEYWGIAMSLHALPIYVVTEKSVLADAGDFFGLGAQGLLTGSFDPGLFWKTPSSYRFFLGVGQTVGSMALGNLFNTFASGGLSWKM
ncbi:MAG: hypothetical protein AB7F43_09340 [Bacteriovoracia bacterium]